MICLDAYSIFENKSTLRETSKDDSQPGVVQFMTSSNLEVINFDEVKRKYANSLGLPENCAASVDAVIPYGGGVLFVEFKNGRVDNRNIKDKIRDSLLIFLGIIQKDIEYSREKIDFILVYNQEKNPSRIDIGNYVMHKANDELVLFDLKRYKKLYFRNVHTYSQKTFEAYLLSKGLV
ncbi:MAG: hypothetical protein QM296_01505 [Bacillota bacterium]|nr:hypothetical protein [Bacillota bacterium]